ncbi:hypothetical protein [Methylocella sp.]|uniref:hypothetical protein n=1 Tax=Methylocella sp. TaxID=1978226 RepID=UPI0035AE9023
MLTYAIKLFDREDGRAADWPLLADALFRAAFKALDEIPGDPRAESLLRRVHAGAYNRLVGNADDSGTIMGPDNTDAPMPDTRPVPSLEHEP